MAAIQWLKSAPVIGPVLRRAVRALRGGPDLRPPDLPFTTSGEYWDSRYRSGGNSGAGSYNRLAAFKAEFLNDWVARHGIGSVVEWGSGDGAQLALAHYPAYVGVDVSRAAVERTRARFAGEPRFAFLHTSEVTPDLRADLSLSLDVIYHLVEDETFDAYMRALFDAADRAVIVYASDKDRVTSNPHVRHRRFSAWVEANRPDFALTERVPNRYPFDPEDPNNTSFADFYVFERIAPPDAR